MTVPVVGMPRQAGGGAGSGASSPSWARCRRSRAPKQGRRDLVIADRGGACDRLVEPALPLEPRQLSGPRRLESEREGPVRQQEQDADDDPGQQPRRTAARRSRTTHGAPSW